jgi:hypothetical protein
VADGVNRFTPYYAGHGPALLRLAWSQAERGGFVDFNFHSAAGRRRRSLDATLFAQI